jgi:hypothetical protein
MARSRFLAAVFVAALFSTVAPAEPISVKHIQLPRHEFMVARSATGEVIARVEFTEVVQGDEVTMRLTYNFVDGSIDDETTTYRQQGTFRLVRNHHIQKGPPNAAPFRAGILAPVNGGRLIQILISPEGEQSFQKSGQTLKATVFRIHPELGGILGMIATLLGLEPKDVKVWVLEGQKPAVMRVVGQLGGSGPELSSELEGTSFAR